MTSPLNLKKRWDDRSTHAGGIPSNKPTPMKLRPQGSVLMRKHYTKCGRAKHNIAEYRVGTNCCFWCGDPNHMITNYLVRPTPPGKDSTQGSEQGKRATPATGLQVGRVYVINKKQVEDSRTVVTGTLTFNSTPFVVLFNSGATHSFISSKVVSYRDGGI